MTTVATTPQPTATNTQPAYSPGLEGVVAGISHISRVDPDLDSLIYRGYEIRDLVKNCQYEEVAYLLIYGKLPNTQELDALKTTIAKEQALPEAVLSLLKSLPKDTIPMDALRSAVSVLAHFDADVDKHDTASMQAKAVRLLAKIPTIITTFHRLSQGQQPIAPDKSLSLAENFFYSLNGEKPDPLTASVFNTTLILYAEHGFNASTFSGRVTVSTLSDLYSGVVAAIGTLKGSLHGGANEEAMKMMLEIGSVEKAHAWITDALAQKKKIMGFGHRVYKNGDTRAPILRELGKELCAAKGQPQWAEMAEIVEKVMLESKGLHPNVDFPTAYIYYVMGLPIELYTPIFAASRVAGWTAHIIEQLENNRLMRPKSLYEGPKHLPVDAISQRS